MKKSGNASPCRYDLTFSSVRIFCGNLQGFNRNLIKLLTKEWKISPFSVNKEIWAYQFSFSIKSTALRLTKAPARVNIIMKYYK